MVQCLAQFIVGNITAKRLNVLMRTVGQHMRDEVIRLVQCLGGRLEPDCVPGHNLKLRSMRQFSHGLNPAPSVSSASPGSSDGNRSRSVSATALTSRRFISSGSFRKSPSSKKHNDFSVICGLN